MTRAKAQGPFPLRADAFFLPTSGSPAWSALLACLSIRENARAAGRVGLAGAERHVGYRVRFCPSRRDGKVAAATSGKGPGGWGHERKRPTAQGYSAK